MSEVWAPVIFAAIIVLGAVGGQLAHTVFKKILPLLETLVNERQKGLSSPAAAVLREEIADLKGQIAQLEASHRRLESLEEQVSFLQTLLEGRAEKGQLRAGGSD